MTRQSEKLVEHLFRTEYGKLVSTLTRIFGPSRLELAEDIVQETLIAALSSWAINGVPDNPSGWLMQVARRKVLNELKRNKMMLEHHHSDPFLQNSSDEPGSVFLENEIRDSQLRMVFTCCHPSLNTASQIALTLKTLCGFGVKEVANALLTNEATINKRLFRAKKSIRESNLPFSIPQGSELDQRLETVSLTLYLLFNEGYNATVSGAVIQKELCLEAMRLTKLLTGHFKENHKLYALLALMCFHTARFDARIDDRGAIILFEDQDRRLWNQELIHIGMENLAKAVGAPGLSAYHIEANIAAEHCLANSFETTNWDSIFKLYRLLEKLKPNPIIKLNLAIIQSRTEGPEASLQSLQKLTANKALKNYHLLPATQGVFEMKLGNYAVALKHLQKALKLKPPPSEGEIISQKMEECRIFLKAK